MENDATIVAGMQKIKEAKRRKSLTMGQEEKVYGGGRCLSKISKDM